MKDFIYVYDKTNLRLPGFAWLTEMGLKETQWILDSEWFFIQRIIFNEWIKE